jgi:hypothetical protein
MTDQPRCETCGLSRDLRPYGKGGALICFQCMKSSPKNEAEAARQFSKILARGDTIIDDNGPRRPTYAEAVALEDVLQRASIEPQPKTEDRSAT